MKTKKTAILAILLLMATALPAAAQKKFATFGVAFYNLENLFDTINNNGKYDLEFSPAGSRKWDGQKFRKKIQKLSYAISQMTTKLTPMGPALLGVSEIENKSVLEDLVRQDAIKDRMYQVIHHDSPDRRGVDVALLYNPRFFKLINVTNHTLKIEGLNYFKTRDQMCVVGLLGGERVGVIVNHWPSRRGGTEQSSYLREAAAQLCRQIADSLRNIDPNIGIIVMGDLNDDPQDKSCSMVLGAQKKQEDVEEGYFFNPFWTMLDKGIGSYCYKGNWDLFDQIIVSHSLLSQGGSKLKYLKCEVFNKEFLKQQDGAYRGYPHRTFSGGVFLNGYSDHFPTQVFLIKEIK